MDGGHCVVTSPSVSSLYPFRRRGIFRVRHTFRPRPLADRLLIAFIRYKKKKITVGVALVRVAFPMLSPSFPLLSKAGFLASARFFSRWPLRPFPLERFPPVFSSRTFLPLRSPCICRLEEPLAFSTLSPEVPPPEIFSNCLSLKSPLPSPLAWNMPLPVAPFSDGRFFPRRRFRSPPSSPPTLDSSPQFPLGFFRRSAFRHLPFPYSDF